MPAMTPRSIRGRTQDRKVRDRHHIQHPQPGDLWSDHGSAVAVVVATEVDKILVCFSKMDVADVAWTWDLSKLEVLDCEEFQQKLCYRSKPDEPFCYVTPSAHFWVTEEPEVLQYLKDNNGKIGPYTLKKVKAEEEARKGLEQLYSKYLPAGTNWGQPLTPGVVQFIVECLRKDAENNSGVQTS